MRFIIYKRHYLLKNYINSALLGQVIGVVYAPYFLNQKIDQHRLDLLAE